MKKIGLLSLFVFLLLSEGWAEESLDLDSPEIVPKHVNTQAEKIPFKLIGRLDLSYEISPYQNPSLIRQNDTFKNNHFLVFLKLNASEKVSFLGEIISKSFLEIIYKPTEKIIAYLGKVLIPFGDTSRYHHLYGGVQGFAAKGVMFPNIWAENGAILTFEINQWNLDTYLVNGFGEPKADKDVELNLPADPNTQALGLRLSGFPFEKIKLILSGYYTQWQIGKPLVLLGGDLWTDYHLVNLPVLKNLKLGLGFADAKIFQGLLGNFRKYGDYIELATNALGFVEPRIRYGTYINNSQQKSQQDSHSFDLSFVFPIDVMKFILEYQWNLEALDEKPNDLFRLMFALDF